MSLETIWNAIVPVANNEYAEIVLGQPILFIFSSKAIIVVNNSAQCVFQLAFVLVVHGDANTHCWGAITLTTAPPDIRQQALGEFDLTGPSISSKAGASDLRVEFAARQH